MAGPWSGAPGGFLPIQGEFLIGFVVKDGGR